MKKRLKLILFFIITITFLIAGCQQAKQESKKEEKEKTATIDVKKEEKKEEEKEKMMKITVYFTPWPNNGEYLIKEVHEVPKTSGKAVAALEELIRGEPLDESLQSIIPQDTQVLDITIENGLATVNFSREVLNANVGSIGEILGIYSIVNTLTEFSSIEKVKFLVEGSEEGEIDGRLIENWWGHVGLYEQPFERDEEIIGSP
jgi:spore germination protein GerM